MSTENVVVIADGVVPVLSPTPDAPLAEHKEGSVPCVCVCVPGAKCPRDAVGSYTGQQHCTFSHKTPCLYSTECHNLAEDHRMRFYHPMRNCDGAANAGSRSAAAGGAPSACGRTDVNHWRSVAHPCAIRGCPKPTIAMLNGWVCGYHYKLMTDFHRKK